MIYNWNQQFNSFGIVLIFFSMLVNFACAQQGSQVKQGTLPEVITDPSNYNELTKEEEKIILHEGTEYAFTGNYYNLKEDGIYICKLCNNPLFRSEDKFDSGTGWPSFDDAIEGAVKEIPDADGMRVEIECANCGAHLGHVFRGEGFTKKQTRHCANSLSLKFVPAAILNETVVQKDGIWPIDEYIKGKGYDHLGKATFAGGCFWCTEASFERIEGVVDVISGYSGGEEAYPTYQEVGNHQTHHAEAIMIYYDTTIISYKTLLEVFFVAHDPTQLNRQGPDIGEQYRSEIFYHNDSQRMSAEKIIQELDAKGKLGKKIVTLVEPYSEFWVAEDYHQDYYEHHPENPYVQRISKPKVEKVEKTFSEILKKKFKS